MNPSASELIWISESLNWSCIFVFNNKPVSATWVKLTSLSAPKFKTAASLIRDKSSPTNKSAATPAPPATVKAPVEAEVEAVVALTLTTPPAEILIALVSDAEPIVAPSGTTMLVPKVAVEPVIANSSVPLTLIFTPVSAWTFINPSASELIWIAESLNWSCIPAFNNKPVSATWVNVTSWSAPKLITAPSAKNKSDHSRVALPNAAPSEAEGRTAPVEVILLANVAPPLAAKVIASAVVAVLIVPASATLRLPPVINPVVVIVLAPLLMFPKLLVIEPESKAPVDTNPVIVVILFWVAVCTVPSKLATNVPVVPENTSDVFVAAVNIVNLLALSS